MLCAICLIDLVNEASINVAAKTGMRREREAPIDGEPTLLYSLVQP